MIFCSTGCITYCPGVARISGSKVRKILELSVKSLARPDTSRFPSPFGSLQLHASLDRGQFFSPNEPLNRRGIKYRHGFIHTKDCLHGSGK